MRRLTPELLAALQARSQHPSSLVREHVEWALQPAFQDVKKDNNSLDNFGRSHKMRASSGSLAQLVEQRTLNPFVAGSIPARPTKETKGLQRCRPFSFGDRS